MAQTALQHQLSKTCTQCSRGRSSRVRCEASASRVDISKSWKMAPAVLAAVIAANSGAMCVDLVAPKPVRADTEEENLTPYERRQRELERRRELLRQAREKAIEKATSVEAQSNSASEQATQSVLSANESRSSEVSKLSNELKSSAAESYLNQANSNKRKLEPAPSPTPSVSWFNAPEPTPAPTPVPAPVTPAPSTAAETPWWEAVSKTEPIKAPEPKAAVTKAPEPQPAPKLAAAKPLEAKMGKRQGPLPSWLAQSLVLGALVCTTAAFTKYLDETTAVLEKYTKDLEKALLELKVPNFGGN